MEDEQLSLGCDSGYQSRNTAATLEGRLRDSNRGDPYPGASLRYQVDPVPHELPRLNVAAHTASPSLEFPRNNGSGYRAEQSQQQYAHSNTGLVSQYGPTIEFSEPYWNPSSQLNASGHSASVSGIQTFLEPDQTHGLLLDGYSTQGNPELLEFSFELPLNALDQTQNGRQSDLPLLISNAETWAKFWIEQNPGKFPIERDRELLAALAKENIQAIEQAFGGILSTSTVREEKSVSVTALHVDIPEVQVPNGDQSVNIDSKALRDAAEWVTHQVTRCSAWHDEPVSPEEARSRIYKCTVGCERTFDKKDAWRSHEELRFPQRGWVCRLGTTVLIEGIVFCSYCGVQNPEALHIQHTHPEYATSGPCRQKFMKRGRNGTIFYRKYRFEKHMKQIHPKVPLGPILTQSYFIVPPTFGRTCVVCSDYEFRDWDHRVQHLAQHFENSRRPHGHKRPLLDDDSEDSEGDDGDTNYFNDTSRPPVKKSRFSSSKTQNGDKENKSWPNEFADNQTTATVMPETPECTSTYTQRAVSQSEDCCNLDVLYPSIGLSKSTIREQIIDIKVPTIGTDSQFFIPQNALESILTKEKILGDLAASIGDFHRLGRNQDELVHYVQKSAPKLFAILVWIGHSPTIEAFMTAGLSDLDLPLPAKEILPTTANSDARWTHQKVFGALSRWDVHEFYRLQWSFLAPVFEFSPNVSHYKLGNNCILPFTNENGNPAAVRREGGFGSVVRVKIHPAHFKVHDEMDFETTNYNAFAVKRLFSTAKEEFDAEANMLKTLSERHHPHLIKLLATYEFQGHNHLVFPWADNSLRSYWQKKQPPLLASEMSWFLEQMKGLASAVARIHEYRTNSTDSEVLFGRHGDIKPENILWFSEGDSNGVLKITDFGLSRFHTRATRSQIDPANIGCSPAYAPPELSLRHPISRSYDLWSLGCVFLECVTWLIAGQSGLDDFRDTRTKSSNPDQHGLFAICVPEGGTKPHAIVKDSVNQWIRRLRTHPRSSKFILDLLKQIDKGLLVVDPTKRFSAESIVKAFCVMLDRAKLDDAYFTPRYSSKVSQSQHPVVGHSLDTKSSKSPNLNDFQRAYFCG